MQHALGGCPVSHGRWLVVVRVYLRPDLFAEALDVFVDDGVQAGRIDCHGNSSFLYCNRFFKCKAAIVRRKDGRWPRDYSSSSSSGSSAL